MSTNHTVTPTVPSTRKNNRVQSADEAHALHESWRAWLLALARFHAVSHALLHTTVHTRIVRAILCDEGILPVVGVGAGAAVERWLGSVFKKGPWAWTGEMHAVASSATNIHGGQSVKVWRLTTLDTDELAPWLQRPKEPEGARDRVLALYAPPARVAPPTALPAAPPPASIAAPAIQWPADVDPGRLADELRFTVRQSVLAGETPPDSFVRLERFLRAKMASSNDQGDTESHEGEGR